VPGTAAWVASGVPAALARRSLTQTLPNRNSRGLSSGRAVTRSTFAWLIPLPRARPKVSWPTYMVGAPVRPSTA